MKYTEYLTTIKECPFCGPGMKSERNILENETAFVTFSLAPYHQDHLLIIPRRHIEHILDITETEQKDMNDLQKKCIQMLLKLGDKDISVLVREGVASGKSIEHLHYHVVPGVRVGDMDHSGAERVVMTDKEIEDFVARFEAVKN